jgi:hypothetical protein
MSPVVGVVLTLLEPDYQFGVGSLKLRVTRLDRAHPTDYEGEPWYPVEGVQIGTNGDDLGMRHVLVRGRCLSR